MTNNTVHSGLTPCSLNKHLAHLHFYILHCSLRHHNQLGNAVTVMWKRNKTAAKYRQFVLLAPDVVLCICNGTLRVFTVGFTRGGAFVDKTWVCK